MMLELNLIKDYQIKNKDDYGWFDERSRLEKKFNNDDLKNILHEFGDQFKEANINYIVGQFAGGHDEGGFDKVYFTNKPEEKEIKYNFSKNWIYQNRLFMYRNKTNVLFYHINEHKQIDLNDIDLVENLLWKTGCLERFGSFAFEGHCNGTVYLDVHTGKWTMSGEETFETYESFDEEGEAA